MTTKKKPTKTTKAKAKPKAAPKRSSLALWQEKRALTDTEAAAAIGLARNTFVKHRDASEAPLTTRLALAALMMDLEPLA